jgi:hypothetical protein
LHASRRIWNARPRSGTKSDYHSGHEHHPRSRRCFDSRIER